MKFVPKKKRVSLKTIILNFLRERNYKKQEEFYKKCSFLYEQAFNFYCDLEKARIGDSVDFHWELYARDKALKAILNAIREKSIDRCYDFRVAQLKEWGRVEELKILGVC